MTISFISEPKTQTLAPSFEEPIEMLEACHDKIRFFCHQLFSLPEILKANGVNDGVRNTIDQIMRYFDVAAPLHHADEEQNVFPALLEICPELAPIIERLIGQHLELQHDWMKIREQLLAVKSGKAHALSARRAMNFARRYRLHAEDEEEGIFILAAQHLSKEKLEELGEKMSARRHTHP